MKKKPVLLALALAMCLCAGISLPRIADAVSVRSAVFSDDFKAATLDSSKWSASDGVTLNDLGGALQMRAGQFQSVAAWMGNNVGANGKGTPLSGNYTLECVVTMKSAPGEWMAIYSGMSSCDLNFQTIKGDVAGATGNVLIITESTIKNYTDNASRQLGDTLNVSFKKDRTPYKLKIDYHKGASYADNYADVYSAVYNPYDQGAYVKLGTLSGGIAIDGYFGFGSMSTAGVYTVSQLKITQGAATVFQSEFRANVIDFIYGSQPTDTTKAFRVWCTYANQFAEMYTTGVQQSVRLESAAATDARLTAKTAIAEDANVVKTFDITADIKLADLDAGKAYVAFGLTEGVPKAVLEFTDDGTATTLSLRSGEGLGQTDSHKLSSSLVGQNFRTYNLAGEIGGLSVTVNGERVAVLTSASPLGGAFAFGASGGAKAEVTDFSLFVNGYTADAAQSRAIDFSVKNDDGLVAVSTENWYITGNAMPTTLKDASTQNNTGALLFAGANPGSYFGPREKYGDFVLKFDLLNISQGAIGGNSLCSWIGVTLGRATRDADPLTSATIMFSPYVETDANAVKTMSLKSLNMLMEDGSVGKDMPENFFQDGKSDASKTRVNVVIIARGGRVEVFYKYASQPDSVLNAPKAVFAGVNTEGYLAICCNYGGNFAVTNFSVTNIGCANLI
ncbi:hypothetical protein FACS1894211_03670 [Clostridia bacterium]|nr:hypothetical protein FACS1894211_03670 [Clostridia bacterium]